MGKLANSILEKKSYNVQVDDIAKYISGLSEMDVYDLLQIELEKSAMIETFKILKKKIKIHNSRNRTRVEMPLQFVQAEGESMLNLWFDKNNKLDELYISL